MKGTGILFDFDGVIGDTMTDNYNAWLYALGLFGTSFTKEEYFLLEGKKVVEIAKVTLLKNNKDPIHAEAVAKAKDEYYKMNNNFSFAKGVPELISELKKYNIPFGLVSGGARKRLLNPVTEPLLSQFTTLVTADDCTNGKPHPEPFQKGSAKLGVSPEECIVVENAPLGVDSAKDAGMFCIAICSTLTPPHLKRADLILPDFLSLHQYLNLSQQRISIEKFEKRSMHESESGA